MSKTFDNRIEAVINFCLNVADKEFMVLVGPSGCGKSTVLRMIAGLDEVTEGKIFIDDKLMNEVPPKDRDIAMVFQNYALYPHMTVYENLAFGLRMRKYPKNEVQERVNQAAEILEIKEMLDRKPKALSGGQRQRVALGRAMVRKPKVFLFDEPLSNLDANLRVQMRTEISRLHKQIGTTMIYVTHDQVEAMSMGDRIVVMHKGIIQQVNTPLGIYNKPANRFVGGFIGSPTMNFFEGRLIKQENLIFKQQDEEFRLTIPSEYASNLEMYINSDVILGIRAEHVSALPQGDNSGNKLPVFVQVIEPIGNEIFIYFTIGKLKTQYTARISSEFYPDAGKIDNLYINTTKLHLFDKESGNALYNMTSRGQS